MKSYRFSNRAVADLTQIWSHTFDYWSENQADKYYNMLIGSCAKLATNPRLGKNYSIVKEELMGFKAGRHIIFYRCLQVDGIEIIRILHEQMDLKNRIES